jgi:hypothetical protein
MPEGTIAKMLVVEPEGVSHDQIFLEMVLATTADDSHVLNVGCLHLWGDLENPFTCNDREVIYILIARYLRDGIF